MRKPNSWKSMFSQWGKLYRRSSKGNWFPKEYGQPYPIIYARKYGYLRIHDNLNKN